MQLIAWAPHSAVGVGKAHDAFLDRLAVDIETAVRQGITVVEFYYRLASFAVGGDDVGGLVFALYLHMSLAIGIAFGYRLFLIVIHHHLST